MAAYWFVSGGNGNNNNDGKMAKALSLDGSGVFSPPSGEDPAQLTKEGAFINIDVEDIVYITTTEYGGKNSWYEVISKADDEVFLTYLAGDEILDACTQCNSSNGPKASLTGTGGALSVAVAGDTIWCQGTFTESGSVSVNPAGGVLTIKGYRPDDFGNAVITNTGSPVQTIELVAGTTGTLKLNDITVKRGTAIYNIKVDTTAAHLNLEDCEIDREQTTNSYSAIYCTFRAGATRTLTLIRTTFKNTYYNSTYRGHCIEIKQMGGVTITDCIATDNIGYDFVRITVAAGGTVDIGQLKITGTSYKATNALIEPVITGDGVLKCSRITIQNNDVEGSNLVLYSDPESSTPTDVLIENNQFVRAGSDTIPGISLGSDLPGSGNSWGNVVIRNNIMSDTLASTSQNLVLLGGTVNNATFEGNLCLCKDHSNYGVVVKGTGVRICYNKIYGVKALTLVGSEYARIYNNSIIGTNTWAIGWYTQSSVTPSYMRVWNNIIVAKGSGVYCLYDNDANGNHHSISIDHNSYHWEDDGKLARLNGVNYETLTALKAKWADWQAGDFGENNDTNSDNGDPMFVDVTGTITDDWTPRFNSPVRGAGNPSYIDIGAEQRRELAPQGPINVGVQI